MLKTALKTYFSIFQIKFYLVLLFILLSFNIYTNTISNLPIYILIMLALSPFIEHFTHKYFLHMRKVNNNSIFHFINKFADEIHWLHHKDPKDLNYIFAQMWLTLPALTFYSFIFYITTMSLENTLLLINSLIIYYLIYEWFHFMSHSNYHPKNKYMAYMQKYHIRHHYKNEDYWYGVTNPIGDIIFGYFKNYKEVEKNNVSS